MKNSKKPAEVYTFKEKRCPECFTYLKLDAPKCVSCGLSVGKVDKFGLAKRHFNWKAYLVFIITAVVLGVYVWNVFFK